MRQPLAETHPELAPEADGWDPFKLILPDRNKVDWKCSQGHKWNAQIASRKAGTGCPYCAGNKVIIGLNDIATTHPEIAKESYGWDPTAYSAGSDKKMFWICTKGHVWKSAIKSRTLKESRCLICANIQLLQGYNDLKTQYPLLAKEADGWDPTGVIASNSHKKMNWKCSKGHVWSAMLLNRIRRNDGCPVCSGKQVLSGFNDLKSLKPQIASEADGWDPSTVTIGSGKSQLWKCSKGHQWKAAVNSRVYKESGCPFCANRIVADGENDIATLFPKVAAEADGWDPKSYVAGSNSRKKWKCSKGHKWEAKITNRTFQGASCPYCSGLKTIVGENDLATTHPELAAEADGWDPREARFGSEKKLKWKCSLGHNWITTPNSRTSNKTGCPVCGNNQVLAGFNDLLTTHPELASEADGWDPTTVVAGSHIKKNWKCSEGHKWRTTVIIRTRGSNCPSCAKSGFDPNKDGWLYFLKHPDWEMLQIGITNFPDDRLARHKKLGWEAIELRGPMEGHLARNWETDLLKYLKSKGAKLGTTEIAGRFDGFSEAWIEKTFPVGSLQEMMNAVRDLD